jgi:D-alanyl-D-alanine carboxypeptidase/D-alanyl-D-alanine-endopeptidase (penicillin-binding protein 4)
MSQPVAQKIQAAFRRFEKDPQLSHASISLYVVDAASGKAIFDRNSKLGLAPASTQKVITSVTAFELLGKDFRFQTGFAVDRQSHSKLFVRGSGDPTFGSPRWDGTAAAGILKRLCASIKKVSSRIQSVAVDRLESRGSSIPDGWIWQDLGNYYGAGADALNWRENQFDLLLQSGGQIGDSVIILRSDPALYNYQLKSYVTAAAKGSGDNAYIYFPLNAGEGFVTGTIPVNEKNFTVSGAFPDGANQFISELCAQLTASGVSNPGPIIESDENGPGQNNSEVVFNYLSPPLDSIIYWFNKKSINLYGEALIKTMGLQKKGTFSTDTGASVIRDFWKKNHLDENELNISDGSGLSPQNRVTTHAQVHILRYASQREWFPLFFNALPEYNGMHMKSGTIKDVKGFCGYHQSKTGARYIFSFLVNNFNGSSATLVKKMYGVLDVLK